jgi:hypothetical protein
MMIPDLGAILIMASHKAAGHEVTDADVIRWIGVAVAVAGAVFATPDGIASLWHPVKARYLKLWALAEQQIRRLLRRPGRVISGTGSLRLPKMGLSASGEVWRDWCEDADPDEKIAILHRQADLLREQIRNLSTQVDDRTASLGKEIGEAEGRVTGQLQQLASQLRGERSQASRVDARGFGPIALGIILSGIPDELATLRWLGWLAVLIAIGWTAAAAPGWLRDYRQALRRDTG